MAATRKKLYCYVDETGQDARSDIFVVVAVVSAEEQNILRQALVKAEEISGIGKRKWHKASHVRRLKFLNLILKEGVGKGDIFYGSYEKPLPYFLPMLEVVTEAIQSKTKGLYQAQIYVDGIDRKKAKELTNALRIRGISLALVKSRRDESEPLIRLADRWAGCVRMAIEGNKETTALVQKAKRKNYLRKIEY